MMHARTILIRSVVLVIAAASTAGAILAVGSQLALASTSKKCAVVSTGGHKYSVSASSASCTFADYWVSVLAKKRLAPHSHNVPLGGGPKGYSCQGGTKSSGSAMHDIAPKVQISGNCAKGLFGSSYFNWVVHSKF